jgi:hypothetical protein
MVAVTLILPLLDILLVVELVGWDVCVTFIDVEDVVAFLPQEAKVKVNARIKQAVAMYDFFMFPLN